MFSSLVAEEVRARTSVKERPNLYEKRPLCFHEDCVGKLPPVLERIYRLRALEDLPQVEIARRMDRSEVWVHRRVAEARGTIRAMLTAKGYAVGEEWS